MVSRTTAMTVRCPRCGAEPGQRCLLSRRNWRGNIFRTAMHRERHEVVSRSGDAARNLLAKGRGWPNALQARQVIEDESIRIGKEKLGNLLEISDRYLRLVLNGERNPTHSAFLKYFGWPKVYEVAPEDDI